MGKPKRPDFVIKTPCDGPPVEYPAKRVTKWRRIGEAWKNDDGSITCRVDLPVQNCRVVLYPNTEDMQDNDAQSS